MSTLNDSTRLTRLLLTNRITLHRFLERHMNWSLLVIATLRGFKGDFWSFYHTLRSNTQRAKAHPLWKTLQNGLRSRRYISSDLRFVPNLREAMRLTSYCALISTLYMKTVSLSQRSCFLIPRRDLTLLLKHL